MGFGIQLLLLGLTFSVVIRTGSSEPFDLGNIFGLGGDSPSSTDTSSADADASAAANTNDVGSDNNGKGLSSSLNAGTAGSFAVDKTLHIPDPLSPGDGLDADLALAGAKSFSLSKSKGKAGDGKVIIFDVPNKTNAYYPPPREYGHRVYPHPPPPPPPYESRPYPQPPPGRYEYEHEGGPYEGPHQYNVHDIGSRPSYG